MQGSLGSIRQNESWPENIPLQMDYNETVMLREPEFFEDQKLTLIYVAKRLREARAVEEALDAGPIDYVVLPESYTGGLFFSSRRVGAFFYVSPQVETQARTLLFAHGFIALNEPPQENTAGS
jgi:hypothetical protein